MEYPLNLTPEETEDLKNKRAEGHMLSGLEKSLLEKKEEKEADIGSKNENREKE